MNQSSALERSCRRSEQWWVKPFRVALIVVLFASWTGCFRPDTTAQSEPDLRGVWRNVSYSRDGKPVDLEAMMFISGSHFSRVSMERGRPPFEFDFRAPDELTPEQIRQVAETFPRSNANAGTYRVADGVFHFQSLVHHNPGAVNNESERQMELNGDRLRFFGPAGSGYLEEVWERVETF